jgi:peroxiredoxin Q/BCP
MAQLRQDYDAFTQRDTAVIAVGPDSKEDFKDFWEEHHIPFIGLADPDHKVAKQYDQEVNILKFGRVPAQMIVDKKGTVRFAHYANSMSDIPENEDILAKLDQINRES